MKKTLKDREHDFIKLCEEYIPKYGIKLVKEFVNYWTEYNEPVKKNTLMAFEKEKKKRAFNIGKRLGRWKRNETDWNPPSKSIGAMDLLRQKHNIT